MSYLKSNIPSRMLYDTYGSEMLKLKEQLAPFKKACFSPKVNSKINKFNPNINK